MSVISGHTSLKRSDGHHCRYHNCKHSYSSPNNNANGELEVVPTCGKRMRLSDAVPLRTLQRAVIMSKACWSSSSSRRAANVDEAECHSNSSI